MRELADRVRDLETDANGAQEKLTALENLVKFDWKDTFRGLLDELATTASEQANAIEDKTAHALDGALESWFETDASLFDLVDGKLAPGPEELSGRDRALRAQGARRPRLPRQRRHPRPDDHPEGPRPRGPEPRPARTREPRRHRGRGRRREHLAPAARRRHPGVQEHLGLDPLPLALERAAQDVRSDRPSVRAHPEVRQGAPPGAARARPRCAPRSTSTAPRSSRSPCSA